MFKVWDTILIKSLEELIEQYWTDYFWLPDMPFGFNSHMSKMCWGKYIIQHICVWYNGDNTIKWYELRGEERYRTFHIKAIVWDNPKPIPDKLKFLSNLLLENE